MNIYKVPLLIPVEMSTQPMASNELTIEDSSMMLTAVRVSMMKYLPSLASNMWSFDCLCNWPRSVESL